MKTYKTIFRIDYPLSYSLIDKLGVQLEYIMQETRTSPFSKTEGQVDLLKHAIIVKSHVGEDAFSLNLGLNTFNAVIEHNGGLVIDKIRRYPLFEVADKVVDKLEINVSSEYDRIGFRVWVLIEEEKLLFDAILGYLRKCNGLFDGALSQHFAETNDLALIFESKIPEQDRFIRLSLGPYQKAETSKYFTFENDVEQGLILDIDIWETKVKMPKFNLGEFAASCQKIYNSLLNDIDRRLQEALK